MKHRFSVVVLVVVSLSVGLVFGAMSHTITQSLGGFPPARSDVWASGGNTTLSWTGIAPPFNSTGSFGFPRVVDVTCGGLLGCNFTVTVSGLTANDSIRLSDDATDGLHSGSNFEGFGIGYSPLHPIGWYGYVVEYYNYPSNGLPPISVTWTWTA